VISFAPQLKFFKIFANQETFWILEPEKEKIMCPDKIDIMLNLKPQIIDIYEHVFHSRIEILGLRGKRTFTKADFHRWLNDGIENPTELQDLPSAISFEIFRLYRPYIENYIEQVEFGPYSIGVQIQRHNVWSEEIDRKVRSAFESFLIAFSLSSSEKSDSFCFARVYPEYQTFTPWADRATFFKDSPAIGQYDFFRPIRGKSIEILTKMGSPASDIVPELFAIPGITRILVLPDEITCWIGKCFIPSKKDIINASFDSIRKHLSQTNTFLVNPPQ
jgi:hypothetical protein